MYLRNMREISSPETTNLVEPKTKTDPCGHPKIAKKKAFEKFMKREPSLFEQVFSPSCDSSESVAYSANQTVPSLKFQKKEQFQKKNSR